tara:strand:+ start:663 stop:944 length:282 start_codon:yes stop_codon:yes gene_type:complete
MEYKKMTYTTNYGDIDGERYFSNVNKEERKIYNNLKSKYEHYQLKMSEHKGELKYYKKCNKWSDKLLAWMKEHPVKWYNKEDEERNEYRNKAF